MNEALVLCDGCGPGNKRSDGATVVELTTRTAKPTLRFELDLLCAKQMSNFSDRVDDLLHIAAYVYAADNRISRGSPSDVFGESWVRRIRFFIPVLDLSFWKQPATVEKLTTTLKFLTEDQFEFEFFQRKKAKAKESFMKFGQPDNSNFDPNVVIPFSGGLDSLAATIDAVSEGARPLLASHIPVSTIGTRQSNLAGLLRQRFQSWRFPHATLWANRSNVERPKDYSQRSRSFLFTSLAVAMANLYGVSEVRLCDNGIVSINLPRSGQNIGALLSRSTHPEYIRLVGSLMSEVVGNSNLKISNKLLFKTKKDVVQSIVNAGHAELIQETVSCGHTEGKTKHQPHCGLCTQCIDRRFATEAAGQQQHDLSNRYEKDVFTSSLKDGDQRAHAENHVRFAHRLEQIQNAEHFLQEYPELYDLLPRDNAAQCLNDLHELFQRHQRYVNDLIEAKLKEHATAIRKATLPENSLLRMVMDGVHKVDPRTRYVHRLRSLIQVSVPASFQTVKAKNERHVQDVGETAFLAARERLARESPQLPFSSVTTKPDFSDKGKKFQNALFLEFKYIKVRTRMNSVITEMSSRVTIYSDQGAWVLFLVYDPHRVITDDEKFQAPFEKHEGVWVGIIR